MKWREYPTEADRDRDKFGADQETVSVQRTGQKWSAGPQVGTSWVLPDDPPRRFALVHHSCIGPDWSAADQDQPLKERAR